MCHYFKLLQLYKIHIMQKILISPIYGELHEEQRCIIFRVILYFALLSWCKNMDKRGKYTSLLTACGADFVM